jgi:long-chain fatty acid transport protein
MLDGDWSSDVCSSDLQFGDMVASLGGSETYGSASGSMVTGLAGALTGGALTGVNWAYFDFSDNSDYTGKTKATGFAGKLGLVYKINPTTKVGLSYHSKTSLGDMKGDATLSMQVVSAGGTGNPFGPAGNVTLPITGKIKIVDFQWPETYGMGISHQLSDRVMFAADYKRINWADVMKNFKMSFTADTSAANGGFGGAVMDATLYQNWDDQDVFQVGMSYKATDVLTLRGGASFSNNPIPDMYMNPLFPAIEENHYTLGVGYAFSKMDDINFSLQHAPKVTQTNGQGVTVDHSQLSWQLMYSKRF